ncbi:lysylphosphatidylglycerol synthase transmembrane domain-containing protein [Ammoniphilus sp. YIM 78166]|uniref:lysylphosphatidylglycerol synthase transmembrane domain-containing protein n=1 Tax=Ammoniphilus sp. YIM 78166 TaxID=1644106 RepID=UPI00106FC8EF|nr:lysylphosphatidylglycerol synthase transmembrane domain-containing protein [Ammoniphilus sp. YIM 78166]
MDADRLMKRLGIGFLLGLLVVAGIGAWGDFSSLRSHLAEVPWSTFLLVLCFTSAAYLFRFFKWELYLRALRIRIPLKDSAIVFVSGMSMSITPGKAGEVLKSFLLKRRHEVDVARSAPIVLAERATDLMAMLLLASIGISRFPYGGYLLAGTAVFLLGIILIIQSKPLTLGILHRLKKLPRLERGIEKVEIFYESSFLLFQWKLVISATLVSLISWFLECVSLFWIFQGLTIPLPLLDAIFSFSFSSIAGAISMLPGGLGAAETSMVGILMTLGTERTEAVAATLLARFGTLWFGVLLGLITLVVYSRSFLRTKETTT